MSTPWHAPKRRIGNGRPAVAVADADGQDLRANPGGAQTPVELMAAQRRFRIWAGNPRLDHIQDDDLVHRQGPGRASTSWRSCDS